MNWPTTMAVSGSTSKRDCDANSNSASQPEPPTFFLDRCLGRRIVAEELRAAGHLVEVHADHFPATESDAESDDSQWLTQVGARGWIILTRDANISKNQLELRALFNSGVPSFVLVSRKSLTGRQMAESFLKAMPTMRKLLTKFDWPFIATVTRAGLVKVAWTLSDLIKQIGEERR